MNQMTGTDTGKYAVYAKLKHDIQNDSELYLAHDELVSLLGREVQDVVNAVDLLIDPPFRNFVQDVEPRCQDYIMRLPYPGRSQGYLATISLAEAERLVQKLSYFKELYISAGNSPLHSLETFDVKFSTNDFTNVVRIKEHSLFCQTFTVKSDNKRLVLFRLIPIHVLLEPSHYVCQLARTSKQADRMFSSSINHFSRDIYRPFSSSSSRWSKTIEDFIDARDAPQLYLTHYLGFKGKSFPRMVRAILNYLQPDGVVLDPFAGAGTVNLEAILLGHDTIAIDMQPLFTRIVQAKINSLSWDYLDLERKLVKLISKIESTTGEMGKYIERPDFDVYLPPQLQKRINQDSLQTVRSILGSIWEIDHEGYRNFCTLAVAYWARSMLKKQNPSKVLETFKERLWSMYFAVRYFGKFQLEVAKITLGKAVVFTGDVRNLEPDVKKGLLTLGKTKVSDIVTSPPYGTAIDYIGDNVYALYLLGLTRDYKELDQRQIGSPRVSSDILEKLRENDLELPDIAIELIKNMIRFKRNDKAASFLKYFIDMKEAFRNMVTVLGSGGNLAMIIGKQQTLELGGVKTTIELGQIMQSLGRSVGFEPIKTFDIGLRKASEIGAIPTEHTIYFKK